MILIASGPVVRINPHEVHIKDAEFYDELYIGGSKGKSNKWFWSVSRSINLQLL